MCENDNQWEAAMQHGELSSVLRDDLCSGMAGGEGFRREGIYIYIIMTDYTVVWQKPTQNNKAIFHQLKNKIF